MTKKRNIITVDGLQVAIIDRTGVLMDYEIQEYKSAWARENGIGQWNAPMRPKSVGCVFAVPKIENLQLWRPPF